MTTNKTTHGLASVKTAGPKLPARIVFHAVEGFGKTSFGAQFPKPLFLQASGETGLETLIDSGQIPETAHLPELTSWDNLREVLRQLRQEPHDYQTLVLDTINGFERLMFEYVCRTEFNGDWGERGFMCYQVGYKTSIPVWREMLRMLDALRTEKKMYILALCHTCAINFKNPEGADFDRYSLNLHEKIFAPTKEWADLILFGNFVTVVDKDGKGKGGTERVMYTQRSAALDAKNRHGLPAKIKLGKSAKEAYENFSAAMIAAKLQSKAGR